MTYWLNCRLDLRSNTLGLRLWTSSRSLQRGSGPDLGCTKPSAACIPVFGYLFQTPNLFLPSSTDESGFLNSFTFATRPGDTARLRPTRRRPPRSEEHTSELQSPM